MVGFPGSSDGKELTCNAGDPGSIPGSGRSPGDGIGYPLQYSWASLVAQLVKNPPAMWETWVLPGLGRYPGGGYGNLLQYSCLENPQEWRRLAGYSPWGRKESDMTEATQQRPHSHFTTEAALQNRDEKIQTLLSPFLNGWLYKKLS